MGDVDVIWGGMQEMSCKSGKRGRSGMGEKRHRKYKEIEEYQGLRLKKEERDIRRLDSRD